MPLFSRIVFSTLCTNDFNSQHEAMLKKLLIVSHEVSQQLLQFPPHVQDSPLPLLTLEMFYLLSSYLMTGWQLWPGFSGDVFGTLVFFPKCLFLSCEERVGAGPPAAAEVPVHSRLLVPAHPTLLSLCCRFTGRDLNQCSGGRAWLLVWNLCPY